MPFRNVIICATIVVIFFCPYAKMAWWTFAAATLFILWLSRSAFSYRSSQFLGLKWSGWAWAYPGVFALFAILTEFVIRRNSATMHVERLSPLFFNTWLLQPVFQSLNEELMVRGLFLTFLASRISNRWVQSLIIALVFSLGHFAYYLVFHNTAYVLGTTFVLFLGTLAMNNLVFASGSIFLSWAMHAGINYSLFGGSYQTLAGGVLNDGEKFNLVFGSALGMIFVVCVFSLSLAVVKASGLSLRTLTSKMLD